MADLATYSAGATCGPGRWTIRTVLDRLDQRADPFRTLLGVSRELPGIR